MGVPGLPELLIIGSIIGVPALIAIAFIFFQKKKNGNKPPMDDFSHIEW